MIYILYTIDCYSLNSKNHGTDNNLNGWCEIRRSNDLRLLIQMGNKEHWSWNWKILNIKGDYITSRIKEADNGNLIQK